MTSGHRKHGNHTNNEKKGPTTPRSNTALGYEDPRISRAPSRQQSIPLRTNHFQFEGVSGSQAGVMHTPRVIATISVQGTASQIIRRTLLLAQTSRLNLSTSPLISHRRTRLEIQNPLPPNHVAASHLYDWSYLHHLPCSNS